MPTKPAASWRDVLPIHPAAELFPLMSPDELRELGEDIKKHGGLPAMPLVLWEAEKDAPQFLLDGRNRLDAMEAVGLPVLDNEGKCLAWNLSCQSTRIRGEDPYAIVVSANIHRRHLTAEQKRDLIGKLLKADPSKSDRQIGGMVKADHKTVGAVRTHKEATGEISPVEKRVGADGRSRKRPSDKPSKAKPAKVVAPPPQPSTEAPQPVAEQNRAPMGRPELSPRDDVGPDSAAEAARLRSCVDQLEREKRCLELKVEGFERQLADLKAALQAKQGPPIDGSPEECWQRSLTALADEVIVRTTYHWPDGWKTFGVPPHLLEHAMRAMTTWCDLVKQLSTQPIPPPPMPQLSAAPAPDDGLGIPEFLDRSKQTGATP